MRVKYRTVRKYSFIALTILLIAIVGAKLINPAKATIVKEKKIISVQIQPGDTLWSIAQEYADLDVYKDYNQYIDEVKSINDISGTKINSGTYLILPYFD